GEEGAEVAALPGRGEDQEMACVPQQGSLRVLGPASAALEAAGEGAAHVGRRVGSTEAVIRPKPPLLSGADEVLSLPGLVGLLLDDQQAGRIQRYQDLDLVHRKSP